MEDFSMKNKMKIAAALFIALSLVVLQCKIIGLGSQNLNIMVTLDHTSHVINSHGQSQDGFTFDPEDYWQDIFDDWDIESVELVDIQISGSGIGQGEQNVSAKFEVRFSDNQLIASTGTITLSELLSGALSVWNNKVTLNTTGKNRLLNDVTNKRMISLVGIARDISGPCEFDLYFVQKIQIRLKKSE